MSASIRGGRRFLYGNFYPRSADEVSPDPDQWRREPVMVCDGGPAFFGVEYDVEADTLHPFRLQRRGLQAGSADQPPAADPRWSRAHISVLPNQLQRLAATRS